ncbi:MAG: YhbY family RNA-binding protein [Verrucomicrobiota bacterium]
MSPPKLSELKSRAQLLKPVIKLGKAGATKEFLAELEKLLELHGLVKLRFEGFKDERKTLSKELAQKTGATLVQQVGHTAVYYRAPVAKR